MISLPSPYLRETSMMNKAGLLTSLKVLILVASMSLVIAYLNQTGPPENNARLDGHNSLIQSSTASVKAVPKRTAVREPQKEKTVYVTRTGHKYHASGCQYLRTSSIAISVAEAKKIYSPCSVCNP